MLHALPNHRPHPDRLVAILGGASASIVCVCIAVIVWVLGVSSASLDRTQQEGERRLLGSVMDSARETLAKNVADDTAWSELYNNFEAVRHRDWEQQYLGRYLATTFGIDGVFVTAKDGSVVYSYARKTDSGVTSLSAADKRTLAQLARLAFRLEQPGIQVPASGVVVLNGIPSLIATATIRDSALKQVSHFSIVELRTLDSTFLAKIGHDYGISGLRALPRQSAGLALFGPENRRSPFDLVWRPSRAGRALFDRVLPAVIAVGALSALAFLAMVFVWLRIVEHIRSGEARVLRAELEASQARARAAEETNKSKSAFIANMSHELRTPLNAIIGFSEMIASQVMGPIGVAKYREYIADIQDSGQHLLGIVEDVLQVSKLDAGKFNPRMENVSLEEAVRESVRMMDVLAAKRSIRLTVALGPSPGEVFVDRQALQQILINIISNAVKFSPDQGSVEITALARESECELCVRDYGCGIPGATLKEIGKPFVQAEGAYARKYQGTGLGLAICFQFAEAIGAFIEVSSTEGLGTTVRVRMRKTQVPVAINDAARAA